MSDIYYRGGGKSLKQVVEKDIIRQTVTANWTGQSHTNWSHYTLLNMSFSFPHKILGVETITSKNNITSGTWTDAGGNVIHGGHTPDWWTRITGDNTISVRGEGMSEQWDGIGANNGTVTITAIGY